MSTLLSPIDPGVRLWLPPAALAGCVRAAFLFDGRSVTLPTVTYYPATPLVSLTVMFAGGMAYQPLPDTVLNIPPDLPGRMLGGPFTAPSSWRGAGMVHGMQILFHPDALQTLVGWSPDRGVNSICDADRYLPSTWRAWLDALAGEADDDRRLNRVVDFLAPQWRSANDRRPVAARYGAWLELIALRAATTQVGRSLRQMERRVKFWAGVPVRELRAIARAEAAFFATRDAQSAGGLRWSAIATDTGYADQAHFCRETRRMTGFSPTELKRLIATDPGFWAYRLWM